MSNIGLSLSIKDNNYIVFFEEGTVSKRVGEIWSNTCNLRGTDLTDIIFNCPYKSDPCTEDNVSKAIEWLKEHLYKKYDIVVGFLLYSEIVQGIKEYFSNRENVLRVISETYKNFSISSFFIFDYEKLKYSSYSDSDVGNLLLTILTPVTNACYIVSGIADSYANILNQQNFDENNFNRIILMFRDLIKYQKIGYEIALYDGDFLEIFKIRSLYSMAVFELYQCIKRDIPFRKCKNCKKFFIAKTRSDAIYCDETSPQDITKTCKEYGAIRTYQENLKTNETMGLYRKIYMAKQMLVKRNPDIKSYKDSFETFKHQSKQWKKDVKDGIKTDAEFIEWLKSVKEKKVL